MILSRGKSSARESGLVLLMLTIMSSMHMIICVDRWRLLTWTSGLCPGELKWEDFFPEWIDEDARWHEPSCPEVPMPRLEDYGDLDVIVARVPCGNGTEKQGIRDLLRLQVNLVVANLAVVNGLTTGGDDRTVSVIFIGSCGPMQEIFRCDDLMTHLGDYWLYKPELRRLRQMVQMPVGSCLIAPYHKQTGIFSFTDMNFILFYLR
ncbi:hypothetical protein OIU77_018559 [Salix suchowensis]|uniref:Uncharacterized protein n=1 Tax=Salix suchowensis TaxID=1278906 RepID=A0ABQ9CGS5_9ROSI|nr:hypothetical protein OIU77_018559 [Salix suchowensis]